MVTLWYRYQALAHQGWPCLKVAEDVREALTLGVALLLTVLLLVSLGDSVLVGVSDALPVELGVALVVPEGVLLILEVRVWLLLVLTLPVGVALAVMLMTQCPLVHASGTNEPKGEDLPPNDPSCLTRHTG